MTLCSTCYDNDCESRHTCHRESCSAPDCHCYRKPEPAFTVAEIKMYYGDTGWTGGLDHPVFGIAAYFGEKNPPRLYTALEVETYLVSEDFETPFEEWIERRDAKK